MSDQLVTIESYQFLPEAEAVRMHLDSEGIAATLADAETVSTEWSLGNAIGYIKLRVPRSQADAALAVLGELKARRIARGQSPESDAIGHCLSCDTPLHANQSKCDNCGWSYADAEGEIDELAEVGLSTSDSTAEPREGVMDHLRSWKRPFIWILLLPTLAFLAFLAILIVVWIVQLITGI
ncbi:MAG TPA: hypothetical protein VGM98_08445 [Schlesneria sp.]|jgi:hypothetical protein